MKLFCVPSHLSHPCLCVLLHPGHPSIRPFVHTNPLFYLPDSDVHSASIGHVFLAWLHRVIAALSLFGEKRRFLSMFKNRTWLQQFTSRIDFSKLAAVIHI